MGKIVVIGAGASGIIAALKASEKHEVILIDKNDCCGKKILLTGNGKCNYWNSSISVDKYHTDNVTKLSHILDNKDEVYDYLCYLGIYPQVKGDYYYPYANSAYSVREILVNELLKRNIEIKYHYTVTKVEKMADGFKVVSEKESISCDKVIIAMGSKAMPKTGSDGLAYQIAKEYGLKVNPVLPSLVGLQTSESFLKVWSGIRANTEVSLLVDNKFIKKESGEIQLTDNGISGICVFNLSSEAIRALNNHREVKVLINFAPFTDNFYQFFDQRASDLVDFSMNELCESLFNYKLNSIFFKKCGINGNAHWKSLTDSEKKRFVQTITQFTIVVSGYGSFDKAQVCTGGISLEDIDEKTMEVLKVPSLYFIGEELDVDGICGGFNLAFAFISGYLAGKSV